MNEDIEEILISEERILSKVQELEDKLLATTRVGIAAGRHSQRSGTIYRGSRTCNSLASGTGLYGRCQLWE